METETIREEGAEMEKETAAEMREGTATERGTEIEGGIPTHEEIEIGKNSNPPMSSCSEVLVQILHRKP